MKIFVWEGFIEFYSITFLDDDSEVGYECLR